MGGALRDTDGGAAQRLEVLHAAVSPHDETLAVIKIDRPLPQAERGAAQKSLRGIAIEHVDLARLQGGETVLRRQRDVPHLGGVAEHTQRQCAAIVDVEPSVIALRVRRGEAGKTCADAAYEHAALLYCVERCRLRVR